MLDYLRGTLNRRTPTEIVLDVGGVGFRVMVSTATSIHFQTKSKGDTIELLTHLQIGTSDPFVRVFGFAQESERRMFELLTSVKGVGPGTAVRILSNATTDELRDAIISQDIPRLVRVKGIGKKTAERIIFDLKEKIAILGEIDAAALLSPEEFSKSEALTAMAALGYEARESKRAVEKAVKKLGDKASPEDLVRQALQEIS